MFLWQIAEIDILVFYFYFLAANLYLFQVKKKVF